MRVQYLDLTDYLAIAAEVTGLDVQTLTKVAKLDLADSALHAPTAENHPLPDGNKRTAWVALRVFIEVNGWRWSDYPSVDDSETAMIAVASGEWGEVEVSTWLAPRLRPPERSEE